MAAGVIENGTVGSVTVAVACALGLTVLVAVTITEAPSTVDGAVYNPALSMVPRPATLHVTVWSVCPDTVAVNARVSPRVRLPLGARPLLLWAEVVEAAGAAWSLAWMLIHSQRVSRSPLTL